MDRTEEERLLAKGWKKNDCLEVSSTEYEEIKSQIFDYLSKKELSFGQATGTVSFMNETFTVRITDIGGCFIKAFSGVCNKEFSLTAEGIERAVEYSRI